MSLFIVVPLLLATAAVRLWGIGHGPALSDDEGTYVAQAWAVQVRHTLAPYTYWYDHPPLGWIQVSLWTWVTGVFRDSGLDVVAVRRFTVGYAVVDSGLIYMLGRRLGARRGFAALAVALWALSPLAIGYSRMVYLDNLALPWMLAAFVLAATPRRSLWAQVAAGMCFAVGVLTKETMIILLPALVWTLLRNTTRRTRSFCVVGFGSAAILLIAIYPLLAVLRGELLPGAGHVSLVQAMKWQFFSRPASGSALQSGTGARTLLTQWLSLDAWLPTLGIIGAIGCLFVRRLWPLALTVLMIVAVGLRPGYLPQPYVIVLLPFAALAVGLAIDAAVTGLRDRPPVPVRANAAREDLMVRWGRIGLATAGIAVAAVMVPDWVSGQRALAGTNQSAPVLAAERWLEAHAGTPTRRAGAQDLLVDDTMWSDLVSHGVAPDRVVWFYKLDYVDNLDPSVRRRVHSYTDFRYVVVSPIVRSGLTDNPPPTYSIARQAIAHSTQVATFGRGAELVTIRKVRIR